ncbi:hypothetical protein B0H17DRAFT_956629, partial [Mycena rosella]
KLTAPLPHKHSSLLFQLRTHHAPLVCHLHRLKKSPSPTCPCCGMIDETVDHYLLFCPTHNAARQALRLANPLARYTNHLLTNPKMLPLRIYPAHRPLPLRLRRLQTARTTRQVDFFQFPLPMLFYPLYFSLPTPPDHLFPDSNFY